MVPVVGRISLLRHGILGLLPRLPSDIHLPAGANDVDERTSIANVQALLLLHV